MCTQASERALERPLSSYQLKLWINQLQLHLPSSAVGTCQPSESRCEFPRNPPEEKESRPGKQRMRTMWHKQWNRSRVFDTEPLRTKSRGWMERETLIWSQWRMRAGEVVFSQNFETCMGVVIVLNIGIIMYEANQDAQCYPEFADNFNDCHLRSSSQAWLYILNMLLNGIYTLECATRLYVERSTFFCNKWNLIDSLTLVAGWMASSGMNIGNVAVLRMFRLVRVVRAVRVLVSIPEFYLLITGLYSSIKAIIFGAMMLVSVILFWAVISVELFHPITSRLDFHQCERCANGFSSIFAASLTLFQQIVAGDAWGTISLPLVEAEPWTAAILFWTAMDCLTSCLTMCWTHWYRIGFGYIYTV